MSDRPAERPLVEWPTFGLFVLCGVAWFGGVALAGVWLPLSIVVTGIAIALHSSITHEVLHGHPFRNRLASEALVWVQPNLAVPYIRFRDTHLAHHMDANLTDPYDDPESNYLDPNVWARLPGWTRAVLRFNNTLLGRFVLGAAIGQMAFMKGDWAAIRAGDRAVLRAWIMHLPGCALVLSWIIAMSQMPVWAYLLSAYIGLALIRIRTFLEHQAHEQARGRTVIVEDRGPLAWLFLNNNLHVVHHMHPKVAWYDLPALYAANKARFQARNEGYVYRSYGQVFRAYFLKAKDPVPHPLWPQD